MLIEVSSAFGQIFIERYFFGFLIFEVVPNPSQLQHVWISAWPINVSYFNWKIEGVVFGLQRSKQRVNVLGLSSQHVALWVLNVEYSKVVVLLVQLLQRWGVNLVFQPCDSHIFNFNRVGYRPFKTNRNRRKVVNILQELKLGSPVQGLALKV